MSVLRNKRLILYLASITTMTSTFISFFMFFDHHYEGPGSQGNLQYNYVHEFCTHHSQHQYLSTSI